MINKAVRRLVGSCLASAVLVTASCSSAPQPETTPTSATGGSITVLAAASLTEAFTRLGQDFEGKNAGIEVILSFGSSATLATQINQGAPADVFAAANESTMRTVTDAGAGSDPQPFVSNTLEIAVPANNPGQITGLRDFADRGKKIALCAPQGPCGSAAEKVFAAAKITPLPDTLESDVKGALQKVALNEVDAALVYRTDVKAAGDKVKGIEFPEAKSAVNIYPICTLKASDNAPTAQAFVNFVLSPAGQTVLAEAGFGSP